MRSVVYTLTALPLLVLGCVTADIGEGGDPELGEIDLQVDNGIFLDNGLKLPNGIELPNGVALSNGLDLANGIDLPNGIDLANGIELPNGVSGPYYAPPAGSGLEQWIDVDPPMRKKILRYLIECALPAGVEVQLTYRGSLEMLGAGIAGLGPGMANGPMSVMEQERVSACMLARVNGQGFSIGIELVGPDPLGNSVASRISRIEGAFFGNLFSDLPEAYACGSESQTTCSNARGCRPLADGGCDCGLFRLDQQQLPSCWSSAVANCGPLDYHNLSGEQVTYFYPFCRADGRDWEFPITSYVEPVAEGGACSNDYQCLESSCIDNVCSEPLANGSSCEDIYDCMSGYCSAGVCGKPAGYWCKKDDECASGDCSGKKCV